MKRPWSSTAAAALVVLALGAGGAFAQGAAPDSAARRPAVRTLGRASWTSDRAPLQVGDLVTVIIEERTQAREQVSQVAQGVRSQKNTLSATADGDVAVGNTDISTGQDGQSRDVGEARRQGDLTGVVSARVVELTPEGLARIEGSKKVTVDRRPQQVTVKGLVRPQDVDSRNVVRSSQLADADIVYTGRKISPRAGFVGKLLGMLWP
jgi:flagellar L-ring protein precursor FlgH